MCVLLCTNQVYMRPRLHGLNSTSPTHKLCTYVAVVEGFNASTLIPLVHFLISNSRGTSTSTTFKYPECQIFRNYLLYLVSNFSFLPYDLPVISSTVNFLLVHESVFIHKRFIQSFQTF